MRRRLDLAMTLVGSPRIIFLDEGTAEELKRRIPGGHVRLRFADERGLESAAGIVGGASRDDDALALRVPTDGGVRSLKTMLDRLEGGEISVEEISVHTPDLDDVFFALTGGPDT